MNLLRGYGPGCVCLVMVNNCCQTIWASYAIWFQQILHFAIPLGHKGRQVDVRTTLCIKAEHTYMDVRQAWTAHGVKLMMGNGVTASAIVHCQGVSNLSDFPNVYFLMIFLNTFKRLFALHNPISLSKWVRSEQKILWVKYILAARSVHTEKVSNFL